MGVGAAAAAAARAWNELCVVCFYLHVHKGVVDKTRADENQTRLPTRPSWCELNWNGGLKGQTRICACGPSLSRGGMGTRWRHCVVLYLESALIYTLPPTAVCPPCLAFAIFSSMSLCWGGGSRLAVLVGGGKEARTPSVVIRRCGLLVSFGLRVRGWRIHTGTSVWCSDGRIDFLEALSLSRPKKKEKKRSGNW